MDTILFSLHNNIKSESEQVLFETFEKLCEYCMLSQAQYLYETKIKFLEEYDEDDFLDVFYLLFLKQYIKGANYLLESEMIVWYINILDEKGYINNIDSQEIMLNIFNSENPFMFRALRNSKIFGSEYYDSISWKITKTNCNQNLLDEIISTTIFSADVYNQLFLSLCYNKDTCVLLKILKFCNNPNFQEGIDSLCYSQCFESLTYFMNEWKVIPTHIGFYNSCSNCITTVDFLYNKLTISNEHFLKGLKVSCEANKLEILKYLLDKQQFNIDMSVIIDLYRIMCKIGHIEIILLFFERIPVELLIYDKVAYNNACKSGYLNIVKLIDENIGTQNMFDIYVDTFTKICCRNHINVLQYLLEKGYTFSFSDFHFLFIQSCKKKYFEIAKIFVDMCPEIYSIELNKDNEVINYSILQLLHMAKSIVHVDEITTCSICHENDSNIITECDHQFCYNCLNTWFNNHQSCPYCRTLFESCNKIEIDL